MAATARSRKGEDKSGAVWAAGDGTDSATEWPTVEAVAGAADLIEGAPTAKRVAVGPANERRPTAETIKIDAIRTTRAAVVRGTTGNSVTESYLSIISRSDGGADMDPDVSEARFH